MRKRLVTGLAAAGIAALMAAPAASAAPGKDFKACFGTTYGQSDLVYGQFKKNLGEHPVPNPGGGLPGLLAVHGPNGVAPLVPADCAD